MKQETLNLTTGGKKENRRALDFYPTPDNVTVALLEFLRLPKSTVWEPACGDYQMANVIKQYGHDVIATDIIHGNDFFKTTVEADAIITNPPFSISEPFIRKAVEEVNVVAMLLKSQYWHAAKRASLFTEWPPAWILPLTWRPDFMNGERGGAPTMDVLWTVWIKGCSRCLYRPLLKP